MTFLIPHQANRRIIDATARYLELPDEKVVINIAEYGNTSAASIPMALSETVRAGLRQTRRPDRLRRVRRRPLVGRGGVALGRIVRVAVVFPGQGSQGVGMGCDVAERSPAARGNFRSRGGGAGLRSARAAARGPRREAARDASLASRRSSRRISRSMQPSATPSRRSSPRAIRSQNFAASSIARSLSFEDALRIVSERGKAMQAAAAARTQGGMSAILGLNAAQVREVLDARTDRGRVALANFNSPTQIVISGELAAVQHREPSDARCRRQARRPAQRLGRLAQRAHGAGNRTVCATRLRRARFSLPEFDVISNVDGRPYRDVETIEAQS